MKLFGRLVLAFVMRKTMKWSGDILPRKDFGKELVLHFGNFLMESVFRNFQNFSPASFLKMSTHFKGTFPFFPK